jgi:hypothetical protein
MALITLINNGSFPQWDLKPKQHGPSLQLTGFSSFQAANMANRQLETQVMKRLFIIESALWFLVLVATARLASAQTAVELGSPAAGVSPDALKAELKGLTGMVSQISLELRKLKFEVQKLQLENQRIKILPLERELQELQSTRKQFEQEESTLSREITQRETQPGLSALASEERAGQEASQAEMARNALDRLQRDQQVLAQKEAELSRRLALEQQRWQEMFEIAKALLAEADGNTHSR